MIIPHYFSNAFFFLFIIFGIIILEIKDSFVRISHYPLFLAMRVQHNTVALVN